MEKISLSRTYYVQHIDRQFTYIKYQVQTYRQTTEKQTDLQTVNLQEIPSISYKMETLLDDGQIYIIQMDRITDKQTNGQQTNSQTVNLQEIPSVSFTMNTLLDDRQLYSIQTDKITDIQTDNRETARLTYSQLTRNPECILHNGNIT